MKINEAQLRSIIRESVVNVLNEGLGDRLMGGLHGFKTGAKQSNMNRADSQWLNFMYRTAQDVISKQNPEQALACLEEFVSGMDKWYKSQEHEYGVANRNIRTTNI